ncbi:MAG: carbohydrate-binding domain-containing protein [Lachnospiraceae bacterium]|nr:carbohydrate-binding domain-containing protein [Lachnospiraceae bacterium]
MKRKIVAIIMALSLMLTGCNTIRSITSYITGNVTYTTKGIQTDITGEYSEKALDSSWSNEEATTVAASNENVEISGDGAEEKDGVITISKTGTYVFSGEMAEGQIKVSAKDENVKIVFNGFAISSTSVAPIVVGEAKNVYVTLADGTENTVTDGRSELTETEEYTAAIYSKDDLFINGTGSLKVEANAKDGIKGNDDVKLVSGTINVTAADDGIIGNDTISIKEAAITIKAEDDGIKVTNEEDTTKGYLVMDGGSLVTECKDKGIDTVSLVVINAGTVDVTSENEGIQSLNIVINDGEVKIDSKDDGLNISDGSGSDQMEFGPRQLDEQNRNTTNQSLDSTNERPEKPQGNPQDNGQLEERPEKNGDTDMENFTPPTGDMQGQKPDETGGGMMDQDIDGALIINGGNVTVYAQGDGLDSNGDIQINGGYTLVYGTTSGGNGAIDYNGTFEVNNGIIIVTSNGDMEQTISDSSAAGMETTLLEQSISAGTKVEIRGDNDEVLYSFTAEKECRYIAVASTKVKEQSNVSFVTDGDE